MVHLDHFRGWRIRAEVRGRYQFVGGASPQPQQYPPMLLSSDRLGLHRDEDRPVLSVPSDQVHVLLQKRWIRSIRVERRRGGPIFSKPSEASVKRNGRPPSAALLSDRARPSSTEPPPSGERRNIFEWVRAKGRAIDSSSFRPTPKRFRGKKERWRWWSNDILIKLKMKLYERGNILSFFWSRKLFVSEQEKIRGKIASCAINQVYEKMYIKKKVHVTTI